MQKFTIEQVRAACGGEYLEYGEGDISNVTIDSRTAGSGSLFVAVKGENTDGHNYIDKAFENGALAALTEQDNKFGKNALIKVDNTVEALGRIAKAYKLKYNIPTVGVTGSVGKTTTKDMIAAVMSCMGCCLKTKGNYNNELGLPLTVFGIEDYHKSAVLEMGMSARGEISYLSDIARPDVAVITNVGMSHIENLGSREAILAAKMEICDHFSDENLLIINGDCDMLRKVEKDKPYKIIVYGMSDTADIRAENIHDNGMEGSSFTVIAENACFDVKVKTPGMHNIYNALAAATVGLHYGIAPGRIAEAIENYEPTSMRMTVEETAGITLINDCYNASPDSVRASLAVLGKTSGRRVAVLGDVYELGEYAEKAHFDMGQMCEGTVDVLLCAGENAKYIADGAKKAGISEIEYFPNTQKAAEAVNSIVKDGDTVLVKASRAMKFEVICDTLKNRK